jgi:hypothetical protein
MLCIKGVEDEQTEEIRKMLNFENFSIGLDYLVQTVSFKPYFFVLIYERKPEKTK